jgi:hypothetical protein
VSERETLVRLAATPLVTLPVADARLLADWVTSASKEDLEDLLDEASKVHIEVKRRGL